jgi:hypothetical protein
MSGLLQGFFNIGCVKSHGFYGATLYMEVHNNEDEIIDIS